MSDELELQLQAPSMAQSETEVSPSDKGASAVDDAPAVDEASEAVAAGSSGTSPGESPKQEEMPFAMVYGEAVTKLTEDLYIPPDALEGILEAF